MIRVGIVGCGEMGKIHAECLSEIEGVVLTAFYDVVHESAAYLAKRYQGIPCRNLDELLEGVDCVYICTPHDSHVELATEALLGGKAVFCEKPMALTVEEALQLVETVKKTGKAFAIGFNQRFSPGVLRLKEYLSSSLEEPTVINMSVSCVNFLQKWMGKPGIGGGVLVSLACHIVDLLRFILEDEIKGLVCLADRLRLSEGYLEDCGIVMCRFEKAKTLACATFHDHSDPKYVMDPLKSMVRIEVHTRTKSIVCYAHDRLVVCDQDGVRMEWFGAYSQLESWGYKEINRRFISSLKSGTKPKPNEDDGLKSVILVSAMATSARSGRTWVTVGESK